MIGPEELRDLVATYDRYGWVLRRIVIGKGSAADPVAKIFEVPIREGIVDAAWFSRPAKAGPNPWEIRYLGSSPFALVEHLDEAATDFEDRIREIEDRLRDAVASKRGS